MAACDWSDGVLWPKNLPRWDCCVPCEHTEAQGGPPACPGGWRAGNRVPLAAPPRLAVTEKHFVSSPFLCGSGCHVPPMTVPSQTQAFLSLPGPGDHKDQSSGALGLPG